MKPSTEERIFSQSRWIWPEHQHWDLTNSYGLFRKVVELKQVPAKAPLFITADQSYRLFINGVLVCRGPARGWQASWPYDEVDVRPWLKRGRNIIAIRCYNGARSTFQYLTQGWAGLLVSAEWGKVRLTTGHDWKTLRQASCSRDTVQVSDQLHGQEHIDLRQEAGDWTALDFDDSAWKEPASRVWNSGPWFGLEPRGIPMMVEEDIPVGRLIGIGEGTSAPGYERTRDVYNLRYKGEDRGHRPVEAREATPLLLEATDQGRFRSYLIDFGRTVVGHFTFEIEGARGGEIIDTNYAEIIDPATMAFEPPTPTYCRIAFGDRIICREGNAVHTFYQFFGFRYVTIIVRDAPAEFALGLRFRRVGYPLEWKGSFTSSDTELERIWKVCAWTQQCCSLDAYVDTPWREQAQWWGDARVQAWNTFHLNGDTRLFRRGIKQIANQTTPDGVTYGHSPTMAHECILPDFTLIWMLTLWDYYWQTGSTEPFTAHQKALETALDYFRVHTDPKSGLITYDDRYWLFLDWTDLFKDGAPTVYNLWLLIALEKMALLYRRTRQPAQAVLLEKWALKVRAALARLVNKDGLLRDGIDRKGKIVAETSIHSQTLALIAGLEQVDPTAALEKILLPYLRGESKPKATPSAYWITYLFSVLSERGYGAEVLAFIRKHWIPMADHGTTWEQFAPSRGNESCSHAWAAHPLFHFMQLVGGIVQTGPGWSTIDFRPLFYGDQGGAVVPAPPGAIRSSWQRKNGSIKVTLKLPKGVKARVYLPGAKPQVVTGSGAWTVRDAGPTAA